MNIRNPILQLLLFAWILPFVVSIGVVGTLHFLDTRSGFATISLSRDALALIAGDMLAFIGVVTAILIAVFTWIYTQSRSNLNSGFGMVRQAVDGLSILANQMYRNLSRGAPEHHSILQQWATSTDCLIERMNKITMRWQGWDSDRGLESELQQRYFGARQEALKRTETFIPSDQVWSLIWIDYDNRARNILVGLRLMDEGVVGEHLVRRLFRMFVSLVGLLAIGMVVRLSSDITYRSGVPEIANVYVGVTLGVVAIAHISRLVWEIVSWWKDIGKRDEAWAS